MSTDDTSLLGKVRKAKQAELGLRQFQAGALVQRRLVSEVLELLNLGDAPAEEAALGIHRITYDQLEEVVYGLIHHEDFISAAALECLIPFPVGASSERREVVIDTWINFQVYAMKTRADIILAKASGRSSVVPDSQFKAVYAWLEEAKDQPLAPFVMEPLG